jgi:hypothetical protein
MAGKKAAKKAAKAPETDAFDDAEGVESEAGEEEGSVVVDLSGVDEDAGFETRPRGTYPVEVIECEFKYSQNSGKPMWELVLDVEDGHEYEGSRFWFYVSFAEKALPRTKKTLAAIYPELLESPFDPEAVADEGTLVGLRCRAKVIKRRYEGEWRNSVRELLAPEGEAFAA